MMAIGATRWNDLRPRLLSGLVMAAGGAAAVWLGGLWFALLVVGAVAIMGWELALMMGCGPRRSPLVGAALGASTAAAVWAAAPGLLVLALVPLLGGALRVRRDGVVFILYGALIVVAGYLLTVFLAAYGALWILWLLLVVVATDIFGYFAGRTIGGPKLWPRLSPKKTWSGTVAGWIAAAGVAGLFVAFTRAGPALVIVSVAASAAAQAGDMAESAIKRRMGEKDSSRLIPGHGGLLDRFDRVLGAVMMMLLVTQAIMVPVVRL